MKKIILLVCLVLSLLAITSCSKEMTYAEAFSNADNQDKYPKLTQNETVHNLSTLIYKDSTGDILVFENDSETNPQTYFYNAKTGNLLTALTTNRNELVSYRIVEKYQNNFIMLLTKKVTGSGYNEKTEYKVTLYNEKGAIIDTKEKASSNELDSVYAMDSSNHDLFKFNGKIFRATKNGDANVVIDNPFFTSIYDIDFKIGTHYYYEGDNYIAVYNEDLERIYYWETPHTEFKYYTFNVLSSEKIVVQLFETLPENAKKYDIFMEETKINITSLLLDVNKGKEKEIKLDYVINYMAYNSSVVDFTGDNSKFNSELTDIAVINYIEDEKILTSKNVYVALKAKNAKIKFEISPELDEMPSKIANNRWIYSTNSGEYYVLDDNGNTVAPVSSSIYSTNKNATYININGKLYNYDFKMVYDYTANKQTLVKLLGHNAIFKDDNDEYYLYNNGASTQILDYYSSSQQYYVTKTSRKSNSGTTYTYTYYNEYGEVLLTISDVTSTPSIIYTFTDNNGYNHGFLVKSYEDSYENGRYVYYRITK